MRLLPLLFSPLVFGQALEPALLKQDFQILRSALEEAHPGIYRYTPKPELDRIFDETAARLNRPMTPLELYRELAPAVAALKCGHTALGAPDVTAPLFPLEVRVLDNRLYVYRDFSEPAQLAGAELLAVNGMPAATILATMLRAIHGDGDSATAGPWRIGHRNTFARQLYALIGLESPFRVRYRLKGSEAETVLPGRSQLPEDRRPEASADFRFVAGGKAGVLKVRGFGGKAEDGTTLDKFFAKVYGDLNEKRTPNLIIDVRDNGGGADELGKLLFSYLVTEPFTYYNDLVIRKLSFDFFRYLKDPRPIPEKEVQKRPNGEYRLVSHENWGTQQPGKPHFAGAVYALMNGGSFSTTCEFLSTLHHHHRATFIGEEAAGGYYGNTSGPGELLVLPNSKLRLPVRFMTYYMAIEGTEYGKRSIPADKTVRYSIDELLAGTDKEMDVALQAIAAGSAR